MWRRNNKITNNEEKKIIYKTLSRAQKHFLADRRIHTFYSLSTNTQYSFFGSSFFFLPYIRIRFVDVDVYTLHICEFVSWILATIVYFAKRSLCVAEIFWRGIVTNPINSICTLSLSPSLSSTVCVCVWETRSCVRAAEAKRNKNKNVRVEMIIDDLYCCNKSGFECITIALNCVCGSWN